MQKYEEETKRNLSKRKKISQNGKMFIKTGKNS